MPYQRLAEFIRRLAQTDSPDQILNELQSVSSPLNVLGAWRVPTSTNHDSLIKGTKNILYHSQISQTMRREHRAAIQRFGLSAITRLASTHPHPFTFTEARRKVNPTGRDRWVFDLLLAHNFRDGFHCAHGPWVVVFWSGVVLQGKNALSRETRIGLDMASAGTAYRLEEVTRRKRTPHGPELSARELAVLQHMADGMRMSMVAKEMGLSPHTLRIYLQRARKKLGAKTPMEAIVMAVRRKLI